MIYCCIRLVGSQALLLMPICHSILAMLPSVSLFLRVSSIRMGTFAELTWFSFLGDVFLMHVDASCRGYVEHVNPGSDPSLAVEVYKSAALL